MINLLLLNTINKNQAEIIDNLQKVKNLKFHITKCSSALQAFKHLSKKEYDIIIINLYIKNKNNFDKLNKVINEIRSNTPFIIISDQKTEDMETKALTMGAQDFISLSELNPALLERSIKFTLKRHKWRQVLNRFTRLLHDNELQLNNIIEYNLDAIFVLDKNHEILFVNSTAEKIMNKKRSQLLGTKFPYKLKINTPKEIQIKTKRNQPLCLEMNTTKIIWYGLPCFLISIHNITHLKMAQQEINKFKIICNEAPYGILICDQKYNIIYTNPSILKMFGYKEDSLLNQDISLFFVKNKKSTGKMIFNDISQSGHLIAEEFTCKTKDNIEIPVLINATVITDDKNQPLFYPITFTDVSERKKLEKNIFKVEKLDSISKLAGGIAHNYNNLLTSILGNLSLIKMKLRFNSDAMDDIIDIEKATLEARKLTKELLLFKQRKAPQKRVMNIKDILIDSTEYTLRGTGIQANFSISESLWHTKINEEQIIQVIDHVLKNSIEAISKDGIINIIANNIILNDRNEYNLKGGEYIKISIQDHGSGISKENIYKIFDPYFTTKENKNGLGLTIVYSIIKNHNGMVNVQSKKSMGTAIEILLPAFTQKKKADVVKDKPCIAKKINVLIMEDDKKVQKSLGKLLMQIGYSVAYSKNGQEAISLYRKNLHKDTSFHLVIIDLVITDGMDGLQTIKELKKIDPKVKAIASSGYTDNPVLIQYKKYGFTGALPKPFTLNEIKNTISKVI